MGFARIAGEPLYDNVPALGGSSASEHRHRAGNRVHAVGDLLASLANSGLKEEGCARPEGEELRKRVLVRAVQGRVPSQRHLLGHEACSLRELAVSGPRHPKHRGHSVLRLWRCCSGERREVKRFPRIEAISPLFLDGERRCDLGTESADRAVLYELT